MASRAHVTLASGKVLLARKSPRHVRQQLVLQHRATATPKTLHQQEAVLVDAQHVYGSSKLCRSHDVFVAVFFTSRLVSKGRVGSESGSLQ